MTERRAGGRLGTGRGDSIRDATGYCPVMARARPPITNTDERRRPAYTPQVDDGYDPVAEQEQARRARAARDDRLTLSERLERLHRLCAQLATMTPARPPER
jgi:hypothetical protein